MVGCSGIWETLKLVIGAVRGGWMDLELVGVPFTAPIAY